MMDVCAADWNHPIATYRRAEGIMFASVDDKVVEPVNLEGIKAYLSLRADDESEDSYLLSLVTTSREMLEDYIGRVISPRSFVSDVYYAGRFYLYPELVQIELVSYVDEDGHIRETEDYDWSDDLSCIDVRRPADAMRNAPVTVRYVSGYQRMPENIMLAIKMMARTMYSRADTNPLTPEVRALVSTERKTWL